MHPSIRGGAEIRIADLGAGGVQVWIHYMLDADGGVFARTVPIHVGDLAEQAGSQAWTKAALLKLIEVL